MYHDDIFPYTDIYRYIVVKGDMGCPSERV